MTSVTYNRDAGNGRPRWKTRITDCGKNQLMCLIYCNDRLYKAKKFPTLTSALTWGSNTDGCSVMINPARNAASPDVSC